jgi:hypothetical protein
MEPGIWYVNELGERRAIATDSIERADELRELVEQTELVLDDGPDRAKMLGDVFLSVIGCPVRDKGEVEEFKQSLINRPNIDESDVEAAVEYHYGDD